MKTEVRTPSKTKPQNGQNQPLPDTREVLRIARGEVLGLQLAPRLF